MIGEIVCIRSLFVIKENEQVIDLDVCIVFNHFSPLERYSVNRSFVSFLAHFSVFAARYFSGSHDNGARAFIP